MERVHVGDMLGALLYSFLANARHQALTLQEVLQVTRIVVRPGPWRDERGRVWQGLTQADANRHLIERNTTDQLRPFQQTSNDVGKVAGKLRVAAAQHAPYSTRTW